MFEQQIKSEPIGFYTCPTSDTGLGADGTDPGTTGLIAPRELVDPSEQSVSVWKGGFNHGQLLR